MRLLALTGWTHLLDDVALPKHALYYVTFVTLGLIGRARLGPSLGGTRPSVQPTPARGT